jgi:hypothetical protein
MWYADGIIHMYPGAALVVFILAFISVLSAFLALIALLSTKFVIVPTPDSDRK